MITEVTYERVTYSAFGRFSKKRNVWIIISIITLIIITVAVAAAIVYFQHRHMPKNASTTQSAPTIPIETTTTGLWQSLSSDFTPSTLQQSSVVAIERVSLVTTNGGGSREYTTFVTYKIAETLRTTEISKSTGVIYTVETDVTTLTGRTLESGLQTSGATTIQISTISQESTSIELTTAVLTATITEASSRLTSPIAQMPGRAPPTSDTFTTLASDTSVPGTSTVDMTFLGIPTALLSNRSKIKSIFAHIDIAASDTSRARTATRRSSTFVMDRS